MGMYVGSLEQDACGIGFITNTNGQSDHKTVADSIHMLENMEHRGVVCAEPETGDGAGSMTEIPFDFFQKSLPEHKEKLTPREYGVGMIFLPKPNWEECLSEFIALAKSLKFEAFATRTVPVDSLFVGPSARENEPITIQIFLKYGDLSTKDLERKLYVLKKSASHELTKAYPDFYILSLSCFKIVYKGQLRTDQLKQYFLDLQDEAFQSTYAIIHSRFSTNTFPKWSLAQPFRFMAHNG